jgi:copper oxidase (laccase) domain-containing protein
MIGCETIADFGDLGVFALVTTRAAGDLGMSGSAPVADVMARWKALRDALGNVARFASAHQVHGAHVIEYSEGWTGWLRGDAADGHFSRERGTGFAVTVADCVPVFVAHPSGAIALLHAGWRGTAAGILPAAVRKFSEHGVSPTELSLHLGPAICGGCYEVSPDVYRQITGRAVERPTTVDLRSVLADQTKGARRAYAR